MSAGRCGCGPGCPREGRSWSGGSFRCFLPLFPAHTNRGRMQSERSKVERSRGREVVANWMSPCEDGETVNSLARQPAPKREEMGNDARPSFSQELGIGIDVPSRLPLQDGNMTIGPMGINDERSWMEERHLPAGPLTSLSVLGLGPAILSLHRTQAGSLPDALHRW